MSLIEGETSDSTEIQVQRRKIRPPAATIPVAMAHPHNPRTATSRTEIDWHAELARHERWLRSVVYARLGEPQAIDDVLQDIALAAVRQRSPINDPEKVGSWLYRLAITQSLLYRRKMGRRRKLLQRYSERFADDAHRLTPDPLEWLLSDERRALVREALGSLPRKDVEILLLKYKDNMSYKQMAELLSVSTSAVESRLHRARGRLREKLLKLEVVDANT